MNSVNSLGNDFELKKTYLPDLPIINNKAVKAERVKKFYNYVKKDRFKKYPEEFKLAFQKRGARRKVDEFFQKEIGLDINLTPYYKMLSKEPILTLKRL